MKLNWIERLEFSVCRFTNTFCKMKNQPQKKRKKEKVLWLIFAKRTVLCAIFLSFNLNCSFASGKKAPCMSLLSKFRPFRPNERFIKERRLPFTFEIQDILHVKLQYTVPSFFVGTTNPVLNKPPFTGIDFEGGNYIRNTRTKKVQLLFVLKKD